MATPSMCGTVRATPKFAPDAASIALFGPGVADMARAKPEAENSQIMSVIATAGTSRVPRRTR